VNSEIPRIETDTPDPPEHGAEEPRRKPRRTGSLAASLALLIAVAALAGTAWMWWQDQTSRGQDEARVFAEIDRLERSDSELSLKLNQVRDELDALASADDRAQLTALEGRLAADRAQLERAERTIREQAAMAQSLQAEADAMHDRLAAMEAALSATPGSRLDAGGELDVAEVDYLLRLASERLQLFADPAAADRALEVADRHLAAMDSPAYFEVRQDIAAARQALAAVDIPDYVSVAAELDAIQSAIGKLPFKGEGEAPEAATPAEDDGWWAKLTGVFASLVTVRRSDEDDFSQVSLQEKDYVRQRLWLQLEVAHLALMRLDQDAFRGALARVQESIDTWFDPTDSRVESVVAGIADLAALDVDAALPDITGPWSTLRRIRAAGAGTPPAAVPLRAESSPVGAEAAEAPGDGPEPADGGDGAAETGSQDREDSG
jgi:uroporphyrin-3 C-methyltransferase